MAFVMQLLMSMFACVQQTNAYPCIPSDWLILSVECFAILNRTKRRQLEYGNLNGVRMDFLVWLIRTLCDDRIKLPQAKELIYKTLEDLLTYRTYIRAFERIPEASDKLMPELLASMCEDDEPSWLRAMYLIRTMSSGIGIGQFELFHGVKKSAAAEFISPTFCRVLVSMLSEEKQGQRYLHGIINRTNW